MLKRLTAAYLVTTALTMAPVLAQTNNAPNNATTPAPSASEATQPVNTQSFVTKAAQSGLFEIQSSKLALQKSQDQDVKAFANRMVQDHTQANEKLKSIAKNEKIPTSIDQQQQQMMSKLQGEKGSDFVDQFKQIQVKAHQQAIALFQSYAQQGSDQQIKQFAQQTLPTLKEHLQMAEQITIAGNGNGQNQQTAQNAAAGGAAATSGAQSDGNRNYLTQETPGTWRASKVIGLGVYNEQNQKVGNINEVLFAKSGNVEGVVIGVGGFLGIGQRNVAVPYSDLQWSMTPPNNNANNNNNNATNTAANTSATAPVANNNPSDTGVNRPAGLGNPASPVSPAPNAASTSTTSTRVAEANNNNTTPAYPDHAILPNASKDQLTHAPEFNYGSAPQ